MPDTLTTNSPIIAAYRAATPGSAAASEKASRLFPSGVTHDSRYIEPYGLYITRAQGPRKWDVDGNCYVDYFGGHGALLLGHSHPKVVEAVKQQIERGTHFGASHETEIAWAEWVLKLVPSAERVRFTSSGTEATLMAVRLARAFTGKSKLIRFKHHFHGWHDHMTSGYASHFDGSPTPGVLSGVSRGSAVGGAERRRGARPPARTRTTTSRRQSSSRPARTAHNCRSSRQILDRAA